MKVNLLTIPIPTDSQESCKARSTYRVSENCKKETGYLMKMYQFWPTHQSNTPLASKDFYYQAKNSITNYNNMHSLTPKPTSL